MVIRPSVIVHGGAGTWQAKYHDDARIGCRAAVRAGLEILAGGGSALDAAQAAVRVLEDDPMFNAGVGAVLNRDGRTEMDASVMDGATLGFGGIAAAPAIRRPIDVARAVLEDGQHVLLSGQGVVEFARERGFAPCEPEELITDRARERFTEAARLQKPDVAADPGTVGAVAIDAAGHVASATSTGGMSYKRPGRIGDTPLCGCGTYADDLGGAASATGHGELIIRALTSLQCVNAMRAGGTATEAAWAAVDDLAGRLGGIGGIVCVDRNGGLGAAHNSECMAWGAGRLDGNEPVADVTIGRNAAILGA